jgi:peptide/nickel transport system substrate-binding protein
MATVALATVTVLALSGVVLSRQIHVTGDRGGTIEVLYASDTLGDLDPARVQDAETATVLRSILRTPYTWRPDRPLAAVPDLAEGVPEITDGGRRVTVHLRPGVHYAPPVDREVVAGDIAYAISRAFRPSVDGGLTRRWFSAISGLDAVRAGRATVASGLKTPDDHTLVIELDRPVGRTVAEALALEVAAPVPPELAQAYDAQPRSTYGEHVVATGPYRLAGAPSARGLTLVRNPNWSAATDDRPAFADRFELRLDAGSPEAVLGATLTGRGRAAGDVSPGDPAVMRSHRAQIDEGSTGVVTFLAFNTMAPPLDRVGVRRAALAAADRVAFGQASGGAVRGDLASHWIPPGIPGFEQGGGRAGPGLPFLAAPRGSVALARAQLRQAGFADGRYDGPGTMRLGVPAGTSAVQPARAYARRLAQLGIRAEVVQMPLGDYARRCAQRSPTAPSCVFAVAPDLRDAEAILDPLFSSDAAGTNYSRLQDPALDAQMRRAGELQGAGDRARAWGDVDRRVSELAVGVPVEWGLDLNARSADVRAYLDPATGSWALPYLSRTR